VVRGAARLVKAALVLVVLLVVAAVAVRMVGERAQPGEPGEFYRAPDVLESEEPGSIIRSEVIDGYTELGTAHRVLYVSRNIDGEPTPVSGIVLVPGGPVPEGGRPVLVYTHGTVGVASRCAPSMQPRETHPMFGEGAELFLERGYVVAATDYEGLGTPGPHPYLVGEVEAKNALDSARAARNLEGAGAGTEFAVWGHSQGGHASLFTGELAAAYAPELDLVAVAAGGPAPDPVGLFEVNVQTTVGKVLISMALQSWAEVYDDASLDQIVAPVARPVVRDIARNCLFGLGQMAASLPGALALKVRFLSTPPWETEPWRTIAAENTPGGAPTGVPMLVVQSEADTIITADVTRRYVEGRCEAGEQVELLSLTDTGHVETGIEAAPDVADWIDARFAGEPLTAVCSG
jgi:alpha-beta hydrolase superfamily lysophospholipase